MKPLVLSNVTLVLYCLPRLTCLPILYAELGNHTYKLEALYTNATLLAFVLCFLIHSSEYNIVTLSLGHSY